MKKRVLFSDSKKRHCESEICKICNEKNKSAFKKVYTVILTFYTNIRNSIARHNTDSRLVSLSKCVIFKFHSINEERPLV